MVKPRTWRWSPSGEQGWYYPRWAHEVIEDDDATWFAKMALAERTSYPPVVMVHGVVVSGAYFQPVAECLHGDFHLYIPDLPGTGHSHSKSGFWGIEHLADGLARWMDMHQLRGALLVANSIGCQVLTMLAARRPDLACALILVSPTMDPDGASVLRLMVRGLLDIPREHPSLYRVWLKDLIRTGPIRGLKLLRMAIDDPQPERLAAIEVPVIVVGGERDPIVPATWITTMAERLPKGRAVIIPNAPHAMNFTSPRQLAWIIRATVGAWGDGARARCKQSLDCGPSNRAETSSAALPDW
jgi:pimeloyl-ACP methyl ester carboxylesterase